MRYVKIVATIGPATFSTEHLNRLLDAGINVARLNMSHGTMDWHRTTIQRLRQLSHQKKIPLAILLDLAGPKVRLGNLPQEGITLTQDQRVSLVARSSQGSTPKSDRSMDHELPIELQTFPKGIQSGQILLIDDGNLTLHVQSQEGDRLVCTVAVGGTVTSHKGVNFPGLPLEIPGFTEKDAKDLQFGLDLQVDYVALSFVRHPQDIQTVKIAIDKSGESIPVIAKIERPEAIECLEDILDTADGVMIARGDLALELSPEEVPLLQKRIIALANQKAKPVITATQMLESMTRNPFPSRAEASDIANAVLDGTDAVMLSAETSTGRYPVESVQVMDRIIRKTESESSHGNTSFPTPPQSHFTTPTAICQTAVSLAQKVGAQAIAVFTESGHTALMLSSNRPTVPILALTPLQTVTCQLALAWGVIPVLFPQIDDTDQRIRLAQDCLKNQGLLKAGQLVVVVTGERLGSSLGTNLVKVHLVA
ncbi:MAG: pyruvate kinase [Nitrospirales bacterium]|nr:pyruvate kinase [Nitrospirales bacterium]